MHSTMNCCRFVLVHLCVTVLSALLLSANTIDEQLADSVSNRLASSASLRGAGVQVTQDGNVVVLEGSVPSEYARARALRLARRTPGVEDVRDKLTISATRANNSAVEDSELARRVAETLAQRVLNGNATTHKDWIYGWEVEGSNFEFDVETDDGDVTLDGEAPSAASARALVEAARSVPGVRAVHSMLYLDEYGHGRFSSAVGYPDVPYYYWPY